MRLSDYINQMGVQKAARLWNVKARTVESWRVEARRPRPEQAKVIVDTSPVTWEGIYAPKESEAA